MALEKEIALNCLPRLSSQQCCCICCKMALKLDGSATIGLVWKYQYSDGGGGGATHTTKNNDDTSVADIASSDTTDKTIWQRGGSSCVKQEQQQQQQHVSVEEAAAPPSKDNKVDDGNKQTSSTLASRQQQDNNDAAFNMNRVDDATTTTAAAASHTNSSKSRCLCRRRYDEREDNHINCSTTCHSTQDDDDDDADGYGDGDGDQDQWVYANYPHSHHHKSLRQQLCCDTTASSNNNNNNNSGNVVESKVSPSAVERIILGSNNDATAVLAARMAHDVTAATSCDVKCSDKDIVDKEVVSDKQQQVNSDAHFEYQSCASVAGLDLISSRSETRSRRSDDDTCLKEIIDDNCCDKSGGHSQLPSNGSQIDTSLTGLPLQNNGRSDIGGSTFNHYCSRSSSSSSNGNGGQQFICSGGGGGGSYCPTVCSSKLDNSGTLILVAIVAEKRSGKSGQQQQQQQQQQQHYYYSEQRYCGDSTQHGMDGNTKEKKKEESLLLSNNGKLFFSTTTTSSPPSVYTINLDTSRRLWGNFAADYYNNSLIQPTTTKSSCLQMADNTDDAQTSSPLVVGPNQQQQQQLQQKSGAQTKQEQSLIRQLITAPQQDTDSSPTTTDIVSPVCQLSCTADAAKLEIGSSKGLRRRHHHHQQQQSENQPQEATTAVAGALPAAAAVPQQQCQCYDLAFSDRSQVDKRQKKSMGSEMTSGDDFSWQPWNNLVCRECISHCFNVTVLLSTEQQQMSNMKQMSSMSDETDDDDEISSCQPFCLHNNNKPRTLSSQDKTMVANNCGCSKLNDDRLNAGLHPRTNNNDNDMSNTMVDTAGDEAQPINNVINEIGHISRSLQQDSTATTNQSPGDDLICSTTMVKSNQQQQHITIGDTNHHCACHCHCSSGGDHHYYSCKGAQYACSVASSRCYFKNNESTSDNHKLETLVCKKQEKGEDDEIRAHEKITTLQQQMAQHNTTTGATGIGSPIDETMGYGSLRLPVEGAAEQLKSPLCSPSRTGGGGALQKLFKTTRLSFRLSHRIEQQQQQQSVKTGCDTSSGSKGRQNSSSMDLSASTDNDNDNHSMDSVTFESNGNNTRNKQKTLQQADSCDKQHQATTIDNYTQSKKSSSHNTTTSPPGKQSNREQQQSGSNQNNNAERQQSSSSFRGRVLKTVAQVVSASRPRSSLRATISSGPSTITGGGGHHNNQAQQQQQQHHHGFETHDSLRLIRVAAAPLTRSMTVSPQQQDSCCTIQVAATKNINQQQSFKNADLNKSLHFDHVHHSISANNKQQHHQQHIPDINLDTQHNCEDNHKVHKATIDLSRQNNNFTNKLLPDVQVLPNNHIAKSPSTLTNHSMLGMQYIECESMTNCTSQLNITNSEFTTDTSTSQQTTTTDQSNSDQNNNNSSSTIITNRPFTNSNQRPYSSLTVDYNNNNNGQCSIIMSPTNNQLNDDDELCVPEDYRQLCCVTQQQLAGSNSVNDTQQQKQQQLRFKLTADRSDNRTVCTVTFDRTHSAASQQQNSNQYHDDGGDSLDRTLKSNINKRPANNNNNSDNALTKNLSKVDSSKLLPQVHELGVINISTSNKACNTNINNNDNNNSRLAAAINIGDVERGVSHQLKTGGVNSLALIQKKRKSGKSGRKRRKNEKTAAKRERKATKTLAIVLGIFLVCWTPFFTCNIIDGICIWMQSTDCRPGMTVFLLTTWLGYLNSLVNPIIYTIFNLEFRKAFKKILTPSNC